LSSFLHQNNRKNSLYKRPSAAKKFFFNVEFDEVVVAVVVVVVVDVVVAVVVVVLKAMPVMPTSNFHVWHYCVFDTFVKLEY